MNHSFVVTLHSHFDLLNKNLPAEWIYEPSKDEFVADIVGVRVVVAERPMPHQPGWRIKTSTGLQEDGELVALLSLVKKDLVSRLEDGLKLLKV